MTSLSKQSKLSKSFISISTAILLVGLMYILPIDIDMKPLSMLQVARASSDCIEIETIEPGYDRFNLYNDRLNAQAVRYENGQTIITFRASFEVISGMIQDREHIRYFYSHLTGKSRVKNPTANMQNVRLFQCTFDIIEIRIDENVSDSLNKLPNANEMLNMFLWVSPAS